MEVFLVRVKSETYAIPLLDVYRHERIKRNQIKTVGGKEVLELVDEEEIIPLLRISEIFDLPAPKVESGRRNGESYSLPLVGEREDVSERSKVETRNWIYVVVVEALERRIGLVVDAIVGQQEIVIKSLGEYIGSVPGVAGATILGNGDIVLIIDAPSLVEEYDRARRFVIERNKKFAA